MSLAEKRRRADYVIDNNGSLEEVETQVKVILEKINAT
jgi:dephospho-CoA kinase